ncbi:GntR family transcriptional regulator [Paenarthrobacter ureafaciens]|uniref:GntR family transcriptional regulator n=1 Tax=Paenarthrobacter ureafaciens TaxID=37931 RepID=UPI001408ECDA|nr:GntR family transcriptional regulator [Paenarthrobacter ureafaciens]MCX8453612.1 GntR family transcriptional regulator [Paenarthrobacter ureafaciens]MCY0973271.1 GntR family transcriptional regulator [Paenarthrobacter ureafaciens]
MTVASHGHPSGASDPIERRLDLPAVQTTTRRNKTTELLRHAFLRGDLVPGQRLKELELCAALNVTRPTLRDAMGKLVHEGILVQIPYKGVSVAEFSPQEILDVAETRFALESQAALRIAKQDNGYGLAALRRALQEHIAALESGDEVEADLAHLAFHRVLYEVSDSPLLARIWPLIAARIQMAIMTDYAARHDPRRNKELHTRLVEVIEGGNEAAIVEEIRRHVIESAEEVVFVIESQLARPPSNASS